MADNTQQVLANWLHQVASRLEGSELETERHSNYTTVSWVVWDTGDDDEANGLVVIAVDIVGGFATVCKEDTISSGPGLNPIGKFELADPKFFEKIESFLEEEVRQILTRYQG